MKGLTKEGFLTAYHKWQVEKIRQQKLSSQIRTWAQDKAWRIRASID